MTLFDIIVTDPPWKFSSNSKARPGRNAMRHYECLTDAEIAAIEIPAKPDALMFVWTTAPMLARSLRVVDRWGFRYVSQIVWDKRRIGTGFWVRNQHEIALLTKRGSFPCKRPAPFPTSVIRERAREHSRKPEALQDMIDAAWPDADKVEMFARRSRPGWSAIGNQTTHFDEEGVQ